ncbi:MAG: elongation factor 1-beta [Nitrososphaerales archaeon]
MSSLLFRVKVFPKGAEVSRESLTDSISQEIAEKGKIVQTKEEPIAFGISALVLDIVLEERSGVTDEVEELIGHSELVGGIETIGVSRYSTTLK